MLDQVIADTVKRHPNGVLSEDDKLRVLKNVPVFAALKLGQTGAEREYYQFRIASDKPRREENRANPQELRIIEKFQADPSLNEWVESSADGATISVIRPGRINEKQGCLVCHGHPSKSPWENGKDILGYQMENMKDGDLRATFAVISETAPIGEVVQAASGKVIIWGLGLTALALVLGFIWLSGFDSSKGYPGDDWVDVIAIDQCIDVGRYSLGSVRKDAFRKKVTAIAETGLEGIGNATWWTDVFLKAVGEGYSDSLSYVMLWRNAHETATHYYAPFPFHPSVPDFLKVKASGKVWFNEDLKKFREQQR